MKDSKIRGYDPNGNMPLQNLSETSFDIIVNAVSNTEDIIIIKVIKLGNKPFENVINFKQAL